MKTVVFPIQEVTAANTQTIKWLKVEDSDLEAHTKNVKTRILRKYSSLRISRVWKFMKILKAPISQKELVLNHLMPRAWLTQICRRIPVFKRLTQNRRWTRASMKYLWQGIVHKMVAVIKSFRKIQVSHLWSRWKVLWQILLKMRIQMKLRTQVQSSLAVKMNKTTLAAT